MAGQYEDRINEYISSDPTLIKPFVDALKSRFNRINLLELGPGSGLALKFFEDEGFDTTAIELSNEIILVAKNTSPKSTFIHSNFLTHSFGPKVYQGIFAKAFIHLFPKNDAIKVLDKIHSLTARDGLFFISTTVHNTASEGYEKKADYLDSPHRYRKKWTEAELMLALNRNWQLLDKNYNNERGKNWLALTLSKI